MVFLRRKVITGIIIGVLLLSLVAAFAFKGDDADKAAKEGAGEKIAVIHIEGTIVSSDPGAFGSTSVAAADRIVANLKEAREDPEIKAVLLKLNTGGGSVVGSDEIGREIERVKKSGKKVTAYMGEMAASGGYWISCKADRIIANPGTLTGSIGVILSITQLQELYDKLGVKITNFTTGPYKDMGASNKPLSPEEQQIFQSLIDDSYQDFINVVAQGRHMDPARVRELADGRIYTGKQAQAVGLVDELGDYTEAVQITAKLANIKGEPELVEMGRPKGLWEEFFRGFQSKGNILPLSLEGLQLRPEQLLLPLRSEN
ncbi:signal peptide peptidase SppA [Desulforamulus ruminis]|uniref:signal peptide peptidase SppA n=1 Tax=Desulforamulus ruminis TaxID=1564 RepID=UPI003B00BE8D